MKESKADGRRKNNAKNKKKGGADDDDDEEMPDMENNPFAISGPDGSNERLYSTDPKKFLKSW